jgi:mannose-6-phosphate isomerase-like protein (cupin superfamily)
MKVGKARVANLSETKRRIYPDGKTNSRPIFGHVSWDAENGDKIDSKAFFSSGVLEIPSGGEIRSHSHPFREEIYYVLSGSGQATVDGEPVRLETGLALWFPANCEHRIFNSNQETLLIFFATAVTEPGHMSHD